MPRREISRQSWIKRQDLYRGTSACRVSWKFMGWPATRSIQPFLGHLSVKEHTSRLRLYRRPPNKSRALNVSQWRMYIASQSCLAYPPERYLFWPQKPWDVIFVLRQRAQILAHDTATMIRLCTSCFAHAVSNELG